MTVNNNKISKNWIMMIAAFVLIIISASTFSKGGMTLGKGVIYEADHLLKTMDYYSGDDEDIHEYLSDHNINLGVDEYKNKIRSAIEGLSDANLTVSETAQITGFAAMSLEGERYYLEQMESTSSSELRGYDKASLTFRVVSIVLYVFAALGVISIIVSLIMMLLGKKRAPVFFLVMNILTCALYIALQIGVKQMKNGLSSVMTNLSINDSYLLNFHISVVSIISLIFTIAACVLWFSMTRMVEAQGLNVPNVIMTIKELVSGSKNKDNRRNPVSVMDRFADRCPNCNSVFRSGEQFCSNCGQKRPERTSPAKQVGVTFCARCGQKISGDAAFCPNCGQPRRR